MSQQFNPIAPLPSEVYHTVRTLARELCLEKSGSRVFRHLSEVTWQDDRQTGREQQVMVDPLAILNRATARAKVV